MIQAVRARVGVKERPGEFPIRRRAGLLSRLMRQRGVPIAAGFLVLVLIVAVFAPLIAPYDPNAVSPLNALQLSSRSHFLGTDQLGRDILSRLIYGSRVSLVVGFGAVGLAIAVGANIGLISGYASGWLDHLIMRFMDALLAFPAIILALAIVAVFGAGIVQVLVAIGVGSVPVYARLARGQVLSVKEQEFVLAAHSLGATNVRLLWRHILPNSFAPLVVQGSLGVAYAILAEAGLSFLGVGVRAPTATWGGMLSQGLDLITRDASLSMYPGAAIFLTVLTINLIGDALRDVLDPRLRGA